MLKYRYSYAQNVLMHSIEAAFICGAMAAELGLNEKQARRAALLHDIGKALTHEVEGSHALIGGEIARKYGESAKIVNAIAAHHEEVKAETILAPLVDAADALSGARPGARREVLESYVKRLEDLETIAKSFKGVEKCFAVQAGREMRVIVEPSQVSDEDTADAGARRRAQDRNRHDVSGTDPGDGHPRDARDRAGEVAAAPEISRKSQARPRKWPRLCALRHAAARDIMATPMPTTREALETTIALEKQSMSLYALMAKIFAGDAKLRDFWFGMARDEARHVGALDLVSTVLEIDGLLDRPSPISLEDSTILKLRAMLERFHREAGPGLKIPRALAMALEVEETELEDLVAELLKAVQAPDEYERCLRLLVHDLGELGFMIERHCADVGLLSRCDALCNRHAETLRTSASGGR